MVQGIGEIVGGFSLTGGSEAVGTAFTPVTDGASLALAQVPAAAGVAAIGVGGLQVKTGFQNLRDSANRFFAKSEGLQGAGTNNPTIDQNTGREVGRFIGDEKGNLMIEPVGGKTVPAGNGGVDTHTTYPNGSNYQRLNPEGHANNPTPHGHGHLEGTGPGLKGQGPSIDVNGNEVPWNSNEAHWPINK